MNASIGKRHGARRQQGVVLFVALIVLIVMTLAGLALLRQMGIGTSIAGNLAFKENATSVADRGTEVARAWLSTNKAVTATDAYAQGYHSSWVDACCAGVDPTQFIWNDANSLLIADDDAQTGNRTRIIIQRLCATPNMGALAPTQVCSDYPVDNTLRSHGGGGYGSTPGSTVQPQPFYRATARVDGPRNTVSYTQVLMQ